jgi:hypothetical protein
MVTEAKHRGELPYGYELLSETRSHYKKEQAEG